MLDSSSQRIGTSNSAGHVGPSDVYRCADNWGCDVVAAEDARKYRPRVIMIGGSNTGIKSGYTRELKDHFGESGAVRHMLGASTSLFGLANIHMRRLAVPDTIYVFEYTLNDISYFYNNCYQTDLLRSVLNSIVWRLSACGSRVLFVLMAPRYACRDVLAERCPVTRCYQSVAEAFGIPVLNVTKRLAEAGCFSEAGADVYADDMHYSAAACRLVGSWVLEAVEGMDAYPAAVPTSGEGGLDIRISLPDEWTIAGHHSFVTRQTSVFGGRTLQLLMGSKAVVPMNGRALGLIANTTATSGFIKVESEATAFRKNMYDGFVDDEKPRIFLKQFSRYMPVDEQMTISVASSSSADLPIEFTMHERPPVVSSESASCEILAALYCI